MAARAGVFVIVMMFSIRGDVERPRELIVWNVGQGQWVTIVADDACWHFDAGGEFAPWARVREACRGLANRVTFSHWDLDHVGFAARLARALPGACVAAAPLGPASAAKRALMRGLSPCTTPRPFATWIKADALESNARSRVSLFESVLVPGDASVREEREFVDRFRAIGGTRWLVLGHHGSRTATSGELLDHLPRLRGAIASARAHRYGHPHADVRRILRRHHVPLLTTEDWGDLHVRLDD